MKRSAQQPIDPGRSGLIALDAVIGAGLAALIAVGLLGSVRIMTTTSARVSDRADAYAWAEYLLLAPDPDSGGEDTRTGETSDGRFSWTVRTTAESELPPLRSRRLVRLDVDVTSKTGREHARLATRRWERLPR